MHFAFPQVLWLLLALPIAAVWMLWLRHRAALRHPAVSALNALPTGRGRLLEALRLWLWLAVVGTLIVALARPRWPDERARIPARSTALMLVLDVSGSMAEVDFLFEMQRISRLEAAKQAFVAFLTQRPNGADDQIGLVTFAARAETICPPTLSHSVVLRLLGEAVPIGTPPESSTNIGDALAEAIGLLRRAQPEEKSIVLISDGEHNVPQNVLPNALTPRPAARLAQALGVRVHTIFVGPKKVEAEAAQSALSDVALMTGGEAFRAGDAEGLHQVWAAIDRLERTRVESFRYYRYRETYPWLGLACIGLVLCALLLEGTRGLPVP